jgi:hypothetical protein
VEGKVLRNGKGIPSLAIENRESFSESSEGYSVS